MSDEVVEKKAAKTTIYDLFGTSEADAEDGKWFDFGPEIKIKIRRLKAKKSRKVRERLEAPYKRMSRNGELPADVQEELLTRQIAEGIVADWKGITTRDGKEVAYSPEAAATLFTDLPELRDEIATISIRLDNFREEEKEELVGN